MAKVIPKPIYLSLNIFVYTLCLSGLIWQIIEISIRYFSFDVNKNTVFTMPSTEEQSKTVLYKCFDAHENLIENKFRIKMLQKFMKHEIHIDIVKGIMQKNNRGYKRDAINYLTIDERFQVSKNNSILFSNSRNATDFIIGDKYCFVNNKWSEQVLKKFLGPIESIYVSKAVWLPYFDYKRLHRIDRVGTANESVYILVTSSSFTTKLLEWPFIDTCIDYGKYYDTPTQELTMENCRNNISMNGVGQLSFHYLSLYNGSFNNYTVFPGTDYFSNCEEMYTKPDCYHKFYLTKFYLPKINQLSYKEPIMIISMDFDIDPSFVIESNASIQIIDFITYILGALGAWLGFSFISINPVPMMFTVENYSINHENSINTNDRNLFRQNIALKNMINHLRIEIENARNDMIQIKISKVKMENEFKMRVNRIENILFK